MSLAAPLSAELGALLPGGRLYLATEPSLIRLRDRKDKFEVQFLLMPYPTPTRYLRNELSQRYTSPEENIRNCKALSRRPCVECNGTPNSIANCRPFWAHM